MSIFANTPVDQTEEFEAPLFEGYTHEGGDVLALAESFEDATEIMEAFYAIDMGSIQHKRAVQESTYGIDEEEVVAEAAGAIKNGAEKIKKFFLNLWGKLMAFFKSVIAYFDAFTRTGESLAKKYEGKVKVKSVKLKAHKYVNLDGAAFDKDKLPADLEKLVDEAVRVSTNASDAAAGEVLKETIKSRKERRNEIVGKYRGEIVGKGELTSDELKTALYSHFRDGATPKAPKTEITLSMSEVFKVLKDKSATKACKDFKAAVDKEFKKALTQISSVEKSLKKSQKAKVGEKEYSIEKGNTSVALEALRVFSSEFSNRKDAQMTAFRAWRGALQERQVVCRRAVVKAVGGKEEEVASAGEDDK